MHYTAVRGTYHLLEVGFFILTKFLRVGERPHEQILELRPAHINPTIPYGNGKRNSNSKSKSKCKGKCKGKSKSKGKDKGEKKKG